MECSIISAGDRCIAGLISDNMICIQCGGCGSAVSCSAVYCIPMYSVAVSACGYYDFFGRLLMSSLNGPFTNPSVGS